MGKILLAIIWGDLSFIDRLPHLQISIKVTTSQFNFFRIPDCTMWIPLE